MIRAANNGYYCNNKPLMTDEEYDILYDLLKKKSPNNTFFKEIGSDVHSKNKVKLPFHMGSMDKIKPGTQEISKWKKKYKGPYIISDKLDGVTNLYDDHKKLKRDFKALQAENYWHLMQIQGRQQYLMTGSFSS